jgi:hypothetical protein
MCYTLLFFEFNKDLTFNFSGITLFLLNTSNIYLNNTISLFPALFEYFFLGVNIK